MSDPQPTDGPTPDRETVVIGLVCCLVGGKLLWSQYQLAVLPRFSN